MSKLPRFLAINAPVLLFWAGLLTIAHHFGGGLGLGIALVVWGVIQAL